MASSTDRGYGTEHRNRRKREAQRIKAGNVNCWRCGQPIPADAPSDAWDLGHDDNDRTKYMGPEHRACNRATSTHKAMAVVDDSRRW
jgi:hypothetical protein